MTVFLFCKPFEIKQKESHHFAVLGRATQWGKSPWIGYYKLGGGWVEIIFILVRGQGSGEREKKRDSCEINVKKKSKCISKNSQDIFSLIIIDIIISYTTKKMLTNEIITYILMLDLLKCYKVCK